MRHAVTSAIASSFLRTSRVVVAAVALVVPAVAWGAALDADSCAKLKSEQEAMEKAGLKETVSRGPEWAKANLPSEKFNEIKRWIEVDEQLLFRCPGRHLVNLPLDPDPPPPPPQADDKKGEAGKADVPAAVPKPAPPAADKKAAEKKAPEKKPPPQRKPPAAKANSTAEAGAEGETKGEPKSEPKAAPKVKATSKQKLRDDAYKPPPGDPSNPFGFN